MKNTLTLLVLLAVGNTAFCQSDQWVSWQTHNGVSDIAFDCNYTWLTTSSAIIAYNNDTGEQDFYSESNSTINGTIKEIEIDPNGSKWFISSNGLYCLKNNVISRVESAVIDSAIANKYYLSNLKIDGAGNIWFKNFSNEIYKYNPATNNLAVFKLPEPGGLIQLAINDVGQVYVLASNSLLGYSIYAINDDIIPIASTEELPFKSKYPTSFVVDSENNFWIIIPAVVNSGPEEVTVFKGGIIVYDNIGWHSFDVQNIQPDELVGGYQNAFKLQTGGIILQDHITYLWNTTNQTYYAYFDRFTHTLDLTLYSDTLKPQTIVGVDLESNLYLQQINLIKLNATGSQNTIFLNQFEQEVYSEIFDGYNNAFWGFDIGKLGLFLNGQFTNFNDKINGYTSSILLNVLYDSINTWFVFRDLIIKFDGSLWEYFTLKELGLDGIIYYIEHAQMDKQHNLWVLGNDLLLKQSGVSWDIMYAFNYDRTFFYDFIISDTTTYIVDIDRLFVYDQNTWQVKLWGEDDLPEMDGFVSCIAGDNGSIFLTINDTIYQCFGLDANLYLAANTRVFNYNHITQTFTWILGDSLYQLNQFDILTSWPMIYNHYNYKAIESDGFGNLLICGSDRYPNLMFNSEGVVGYSEVIGNTEDVPLENCGYYINEMQGLEIKVFPNPATTYMDVYLSLLNAGDININIYDITGQLMVNETKSAVDKGVLLLNYDVSNFTPGVYFIHVNANNQTSSLSFVCL